MTRAPTPRWRFLLTVSIALTLVGPGHGAPVPLPRAHAHNDYEHPRPLHDALDHGFCSVEADVWLIDGALLVAHDRERAHPARTLRALYLDPLRQRVRQNNGRVHRDGPPFFLLIDIKADATNTYRALQRELADFQAILTRFESNRVATNAVTVVVSGNRPVEWMQAEAIRWAAYDGRLTDLGQEHPPALVPWISDNWTRHFEWRGVGIMPPDEQRKLRRLVEQTHAEGKQFRLWAAPDRPEAWAQLLESGVDWINTDRLAEFAAFAAGSRRAQ